MSRHYDNDKTTGERYSITTCDDTGETINSREWEDLQTAHNDGYLRTKHWKDLRQNYIDQSNCICENCLTDLSNKTKFVMHRSRKAFNNAGSETFSDLILLCDSCHKKHRKKLSNYE